MSTAEMSRRSVLAGGVVAFAAGVAGYLVARRSDAAEDKGPGEAANGYGPAPYTAAEPPLAALTDVPQGGGLVLASAGVVLTRDDSGNVHAFSATCTHQGCRVSSVTGGAINCPCHGSTFDSNTGAVLGGPAPRPLPKVPVVVRNGQIVRS